jgi:hypothetical protein
MEEVKEQKNSQQAHHTPPDMEKLKVEQERLEKFKNSDHVAPKKTGKLFGAVSMYGVAVDFGLAIFVPLIICIYLAKFLANKTGDVWYFPVGIFIAISVSSVTIYRQVINLKKKALL